MSSSSTGPARLRILICTIAFPGHVNPALPIATELVARGHDVGWYTGRDFRATVERTGARFFPVIDGSDPPEQQIEERFGGRPPLEGVAALRFDLKHRFLDEVPAHIGDLRRILDEFPAAVLLADTAFVAASLLHQVGGPPFATLGISVLPLPSRDTPPLGTGRQPASTALGRWRDRSMGRIASKVLFRDVQRHLQSIRAQLGLPRSSETVFELMVSPHLYLHGSVPAFEYPRSDLPTHVHFVGPLQPDLSRHGDLPSWMSQIDHSKPVVLVTQGTVATDLQDLVAPTLRGLGSADLTVIATGGAGVHELGLRIPANAFVEEFVPYDALLPHVDVIVTNGGFGSVQLALAHGIPIVVAGTTEDKPEIAARVAWSEAGVSLGVKRPTPDQVRKAVFRVLREPSFKRNADRIAGEMASYDAPRMAADLLEQVAARTGSPATQGASPLLGS
jgi:MGT family glycosyltransferase